VASKGAMWGADFEGVVGGSVACETMDQKETREE